MENNKTNKSDKEDRKMKKDITKYNVHTDKWGKLVALEGNGEIPFNIKRV